MGTERLQTLREMLAEDPDDAFTRYALALELKGQGLVAEARAELEGLIERRPEYLAAYYQCGSLLHVEGHPERATLVIRQGIERAVAAGDTHTKGELEDLLEDVEE